MRSSKSTKFILCFKDAKQKRDALTHHGHVAILNKYFPFYSFYDTEFTSLPIVALLSIFKDMRSQILGLFFAKPVYFEEPISDKTRRPGPPRRIGLRFLQMLSPKEIAEKVKNIVVQWRRAPDRSHPDYNNLAIFDILVSSSSLSSLVIEADFDDVHSTWGDKGPRTRSLSKRTDPSQHPGWSTILKIRECERITLVHTGDVGKKPFALDQRKLASRQVYLKEMEDILNRTCSQPRTAPRIADGNSKSGL
jgi:hypothetical protein